MVLASTIDHERGGRLLEGARTVDLDQFALLDRIINIKFHRRSGRSFCLRSDYEVKFAQDGQPYFAPIVQKPAIKIEYKQVAQGTAIEIKVRLTNLHIVNEKVGRTIFSAVGDPITRLDIHMGYRKQFPNWTLPPLAFDDADSEDVRANRLNMFYDMADFQLTNAIEMLDTSLFLSVRVLTCQPENLPPDRVILFDCVVGTITYGLRWNTPGSMVQYFSEPANFPRTITSPIERLFFFYITQRFFRLGVNVLIWDSVYDNFGEITVEENMVGVMDYDPINKQLIPVTPQRLALSIEQRWTRLEMQGGLMHPEDAAVLGVQIFCSPMVLAMSVGNTMARTTTSGSAPDQFRVDIIPFQLNEQAQLIAIQQQFPDIRWVQMQDGSFIIFHVREASTGLTTATSGERSRRQYQPLLLPAVYDISFGATRTIRCPFIGFLSPGQILGFAAKYNISDLVGYFYPHRKHDWFRVIIADVIFSTVEDDNMMTLMCVDAPPPLPRIILANEGWGLRIIRRDTPGSGGRRIDWVKMPILNWWDHRNIFRPANNTTWNNLAASVVLENPELEGIEGVPRRTRVPDARDFTRNPTAAWTDVANALNWFFRVGVAPDGSGSNDEQRALYWQQVVSGRRIRVLELNLLIRHGLEYPQLPSLFFNDRNVEQSDWYYFPIVRFV